MSKEEWRNLWTEFGPKISLKAVIIVAGVFLIITGLVLIREWQKLPNGKLKFVACNVGQGDAFYLKTPKGLDILVDGGPDDKVLPCLSHNMPFWDRKLEIVFLTHNHSDHATGLNFVKTRYQIDKFFDNKTLAADDKIKTGDGVVISVLWPSREFVQYDQAASPAGGSDQNPRSLVLKINDYLLMGDAGVDVQPQILALNPDLSGIDVLKVPHHGARDALLPEFLQLVHPARAVISVGPNDFGHPAPETIKMLEDLGVKIERTDKQ